jgi:hypothetical protein
MAKGSQHRRRYGVNDFRWLTQSDATQLLVSKVETLCEDPVEWENLLTDIPSGYRDAFLIVEHSREDYRNNLPNQIEHLCTERLLSDGTVPIAVVLRNAVKECKSAHLPQAEFFMKRLQDCRTRANEQCAKAKDDPDEGPSWMQALGFIEEQIKAANRSDGDSGDVEPAETPGLPQVQPAKKALPWVLVSWVLVSWVVVCLITYLALLWLLIPSDSPLARPLVDAALKVAPTTRPETHMIMTSLDGKNLPSKDGEWLVKPGQTISITIVPAPSIGGSPQYEVRNDGGSLSRLSPSEYKLEIPAEAKQGTGYRVRLRKIGSETNLSDWILAVSEGESR